MTFTSAGTVGITENSAGAFYQAVASGSNGNATSFSITGGADAALFSITSAGQLSFIASPNFDLPADANSDNVYHVEIGASDGSMTASLSLAVTVTNSKEGIAVHRIATGFTDPVAIVPLSSGSLLVAEKTGAIYHFDPQTGIKSLIIRIGVADGENVIIRALAPSAAVAADDGIFFVMYTTDSGFLAIDQYFRRTSDNMTVRGNFGQSILRTPAPNYAGGGWLGINSHRAEFDLLAATGDAGGDPSGSAQDDSSLLGKVIRIVNSDPYAGASVPANPSLFHFSIVAKGLHHPSGGGEAAGGLLIGDIGQDLVQEVDFFGDGAGISNYGWPALEGTQLVRGTAPADPIPPAIEYPIGMGFQEGMGVVAGAAGPFAIGSLVNQFVFADQDGAIFTTPILPIQVGTTVTGSMLERRDADFAPDAGAIDHPVAIAAARDETLYILDSDGEIFRVDAG